MIGWIFTNMSFVVPAKQLCETEPLLAFRQPKPAYRFPVVLVPKTAIANFAALDPKNTSFLSDVVTTVQKLVKEFNLGGSYRLVVNGGENQGFPYLHFHLISDITENSSPENGTHA